MGAHDWIGVSDLRQGLDEDGSHFVSGQIAAGEDKGRKHGPLELH